MVNSSRFAFDPRIDKSCGSTLREKLPRSVRLWYINWGSKECQYPLADPNIFVWPKIPLLLLSLHSQTRGTHMSASPPTSSLLQPPPLHHHPLLTSAPTPRRRWLAPPAGRAPSPTGRAPHLAGRAPPVPGLARYIAATPSYGHALPRPLACSPAPQTRLASRGAAAVAPPPSRSPDGAPHRPTEHQ